MHTVNRQLEVITGCMFSGKTEELIRRLDRVHFGLKVLLFKSAIDNRYKKDVVVTHCGREFSAIIVQPDKATLRGITSLVGSKALNEAAVVAFDEGNLFSMQLPSLCQDLVRLGKRVIVAGLDLTFAEEPFLPMPTLMALADRVDKLQAVCAVCGGVATRSQRLINGKPAPMDGPVIQVGGPGSYEARCRACYVR